MAIVLITQLSGSILGNLCKLLCLIFLLKYEFTPSCVSLGFSQMGYFIYSLFENKGNSLRKLLYPTSSKLGMKYFRIKKVTNGNALNIAALRLNNYL